MRLSTSKIKLFKSCRRAYQLRYMENLVPVQMSESLATGKTYHKLLEELNSGVTLANNPDYAEDYSKEMAMARAYEHYIYPKFRVVEAEKWLEKELPYNDKFVGVADGIANDGHIVEHKTTGSEITEEYEYNLQWDEQILAYMYLTGMRKVWYTVCRKPTIRQKKDETDKAFFYRMLDWYDEDTDKKIRLLEITRTDEEVDTFERELLDIANTMDACEKNKDVRNNFYRNTCHCSRWGRPCEYRSICLHYDPNQNYIEYERREEEYGTTED